MRYALFICGHYTDYSRNQSSAVAVPAKSTDNQEFTVRLYTLFKFGLILPRSKFFPWGHLHWAQHLTNTRTLLYNEIFRAIWFDIRIIFDIRPCFLLDTLLKSALQEHTVVVNLPFGGRCTERLEGSGLQYYQEESVSKFSRNGEFLGPLLCDFIWKWLFTTNYISGYILI